MAFRFLTRSQNLANGANPGGACARERPLSATYSPPSARADEAPNRLLPSFLEPICTSACARAHAGVAPTRDYDAKPRAPRLQLTTLILIENEITTLVPPPLSPPRHGEHGSARLDAAGFPLRHPGQ